MEAHHIDVKHLQAADYADYLKSIGIETVPVLFVNESREKIFLLGRDAIRNYMLTTCRAVLEPVSPGYLPGLDGTIGLSEGTLYEGECMRTESCD